jgi:spore coat protein U-like protein
MVKRIILIVAIAMIAFSGVALAADTNTVTVNANVVGTCKFNSATSTLAFGGLDPSSGAPVNASTSTTFWCTKNASYSIGDDDGAYDLIAPVGQKMKHQSLNEYIAYNFGYTPTTGTGSGPSTPITLDISGTVAFAAYQNASEGNYSDSVVLSINP